MQVIGFCGLPGSGKSTAIESIVDLGSVVTMGDIVRDEAKRRGINPTDENLGKIGRELRSKHGPEIIAKKCIEYIRNLHQQVIFVDGIRSRHEVKEFRKKWKFPLIAIVLGDKKRFNRLYERARSDDPKNFENLKERDERESNYGLKEVIKEADYKINNDSSIKSLKKKTRTIVLSIIKNY
ncbi:MAG: flagellar hook-basal body complex protein FliE [Promethearchaeota archaeon]|nr:MAG: flagellar hook-basal body complex protein FliE [Candidatus Lokiarchaeota archaeon]